MQNLTNPLVYNHTRSLCSYLRSLYISVSSCNAHAGKPTAMTYTRNCRDLCTRFVRLHVVYVSVVIISWYSIRTLYTRYIVSIFSQLDFLRFCPETMISRSLTKNNSQRKYKHIHTVITRIDIQIGLRLILK